MKPTIFFVLILILLGCNQQVENPLLVSAKPHDFIENPPLLQRILDTPHGYFRYINVEFTRYICHEFRNMIELSPLLNLHGDAHLEQYAVTDLGRGLTDFDDSSTGPGIVDIMRFMVSLRLVCDQLGWPEHADELENHFLDAYLKALHDTGMETIAPAAAQRLRAGFSHDRSKYFQWIDSIMLDMSGGERDSLEHAMRSYIRTELLENPDVDPVFYRIQDAGRLQMGIGSALDLKYLVRIHGKTDSPLDDVVLECKEVRNLEGIDCINTGQPQDPFRILVGQARIAYQPFHHLGYFRFKDRNFWVHSWVDNYKEMSIADSYRSPEELKQVVYDIGVQLGKGHVRQISTPFDLHIRLQQIQIVDANRERILRESVKLQGYVMDAWQRFKEEMGE